MQARNLGLNSLLVVGASARAAAASVKRAAWQPLAADMFCDSDLRALGYCERLDPYPHDATRMFATVKADAWMYAGGLENYPHLVDKLAQKLPLLGNASEVLLRVRNPWTVAAVLGAEGISVPKILPAGEVPRDGDWISKPIRSCGGKGVLDWNGENVGSFGEVTSAVDSLHGRIFQKRVQGQLVGAVFVADGTRSQLVGVTEQMAGTNWLGASGFMYAGSFGPIEIASNARTQLRDIGAALTAAFQLRGIFEVDAIWDGVNAWPIEVNPRYTASVEVLERSLNISIVRAHVQACQKAMPPIALPIRPPHVSGKGVVYAQENFVVSSALLEFIEAVNSQSRSPAIADIPNPGELILKGRPVVSLLADASNNHQVMEQLQRMAYSIGVVMHGRDLSKTDA